MKKLLTICILIHCHLLFSQEEQISICNCWDSTFSAHGLNYNEVVFNLENEFIKSGYLKNTKPKSYLTLFDKIIETNDYFHSNIPIHYLLIQEFNHCFKGNKCSKTGYEKINKMNQIMLEYRDLSPRLTFSDLKNVFNDRDYNNPLVKHYVLVFYTAPLYNTNSGISRKLPPYSENNKTPIPKLESRSILRIYIDENDKIFIDESLTQLDEIANSVYNHITDLSNSERSSEVEEIKLDTLGFYKVSRCIVQYNVERGTSYNLYLEVHKRISIAYDKARNEFAVKNFGMSYEDIMNNSSSENDYRKKIIRKAIPKKISEVEPDK